MKICKSCEKSLPLNEFSNYRYKGVLYLRGSCKGCISDSRRKFYKDNKISILKGMASAYAADSSWKIKSAQEYYNKNIEEKREYGRSHYRKNHVAYKRRAMERRSHIKIATPKWSITDNRAVYYLAAKAMDFFNPFTVHEVDHVIPLRGKLVSGLNVESNLQILPREENLFKRNKYDIV